MHPEAAVAGRTHTHTYTGREAGSSASHEEMLRQASHTGRDDRHITRTKLCIISDSQPVAGRVDGCVAVLLKYFTCVGNTIRQSSIRDNKEISECIG